MRDFPWNVSRYAICLPDLIWCGDVLPLAVASCPVAGAPRELDTATGFAISFKTVIKFPNKLEIVDFVSGIVPKSLIIEAEYNYLLPCKWIGIITNNVRLRFCS